MRTIQTLLLIFSAIAVPFGSLQAQPPLSTGRELPRSALRVYPTQEQAAAAAAEGNSYLRPLTDWTHEGDAFSVPFTVPFSWINRQIFFHLDAAPAAYEVWVNGKSAGTNSDPALPAEFNLTKWVREGSNRVEIRLRPSSETAPLESWRTGETPRPGAAWVTTQPTLYVRDVLVRTRIGENRSATAEIGLVVKTASLNPRTSRIHYELFDPEGQRLAGGSRDITLDMRREDTIRFLATLPAAQLWHPEHPLRCTLRVKTQHEGRFAEYLELPLGFREVTLQDDGTLLLNGEAVALRAVSVSPGTAPEAVDALREQGYNTLRLQAGPVRPGLYEACDRHGLLVIATAPVNTRNSGDSRKKGGNPSNDPAWKAYFIERMADSYHTAKLHPSVIAFALAEASANGICLYESYLAAKQFDDPRPFIYRDGGNEWNNDPLLLEVE